MEEAERGVHLSESAQNGPRAGPRVSIRRAHQSQPWNRQYRRNFERGNIGATLE